VRQAILWDGRELASRAAFRLRTIRMAEQTQRDRLLRDGYHMAGKARSQIATFQALEVFEPRFDRTRTSRRAVTIEM
jgi:hypothetical protein